MKAAITELEVSLHALEHNEPIHRKEGRIDEANLCLDRAAQFRQAIVVLKAIDAGCMS